jgi:hypothetical protein
LRVIRDVKLFLDHEQLLKALRNTPENRAINEPTDAMILAYGAAFLGL